MKGYAMLKVAMANFKRAGENKEYVIGAVKSSWAADQGFKKKFTDGTDADLQSAIDFINTHWDAV